MAGRVNCRSLPVRGFRGLRGWVQGQAHHRGSPFVFWPQASRATRTASSRTSASSAGSAELAGSMCGMVAVPLRAPANAAGARCGSATVGRRVQPKERSIGEFMAIPDGRGAGHTVKRLPSFGRTGSLRVGLGRCLRNAVPTLGPPGEGSLRHVRGWPTCCGAWPTIRPRLHELLPWNCTEQAAKLAV